MYLTFCLKKSQKLLSQIIVKKIQQTSLNKSKFKTIADSVKKIFIEKIKQKFPQSEKLMIVNDVGNNLLENYMKDFILKEIEAF
jgi:hypothetical protein